MILEALQALTGIFVVVYDGQHALKFTLGRAEGVVGPGVHFKFPIIQKFRLEETKHTTLDLEPQVIQLVDDLVYEVECKLVYQIVDLRKAIIEIDDLVVGLQNRVVMAVQQVVGSCDRHSIRDTQKLIDGVVRELAIVEEQWGVRVHQLGFSNISPSPTTLEITQLELLAREKLALYRELREAGLSDEAAVSLVSGAVIAVHPDDAPPTLARARRADEVLERSLRAEPSEEEEEPEAEDADEDDED
jgi:regulator of protease activity HflC (stomatin/prohibitin superfamily)